MSVDRTYTFPDGTAVTLKPVPPLTLEQIVNSEAGKPKVPVVHLGKNKRAEANPDDPKYQADVEAWQQNKTKRVLMYLASEGVEDDPPDEAVEKYAQYVDPSAPFEEIKYLWLSSKLPDETEIARFIEAVSSQTVVTEEAIKEAEDAHFQGDGERAADTELSLQSAADGQHQDLAGV